MVSKTPSQEELKPLTKIQAAFVDEYARSGFRDAQACYQRVNPKCRNPGSASAASIRMLSMPAVRRAIAIRGGQVADVTERATGVTAEHVVVALARMGMYDLRDLFDAQGNPIPVQDLPPEASYGVAGIEVETRETTNKAGTTVITTTRRYRLVDRARPLDMLMQHLNGYRAHRAAATDPIVALLRGMRRSAIPVVSEHAPAIQADAPAVGLDPGPEQAE